MANPQQVGDFIATTSLFDAAQLQAINVNDPEFKQLLIKLYQSVNDICLRLNKKDSGFYVTSEFVNGQIYFPNPNLNSTTSSVATLRQVTRKVINMGPLSNAGTTTKAHGIPITSNTTFTRIYATASDTTNNFYIPIPNSDNYNTSMVVTLTNVEITTTVDLSAYDTCYAILEYLQT